LALEEFAPLLNHPSMVSVREAREEERFADAATELSQLLASSLAQQAELPEYSFLQGRLWDEASRYPEAIVAYHRAAAVSWPLQDYARYMLARVLLRHGNAPLAVELLRSIPERYPFEDERQLLLAEAANQLKEDQHAASILRSQLAKVPLPADWSRASLMLAETLLRLAKAARSGETPSAVDDLLEALSATRKVGVTFAGSPTADRAMALEQQVAAALPKDVFFAHQALQPAEQLVRVNALMDARKFADALIAADELIGSLETRNEKFSDIDCEVRVQRNKALFGESEYTRAADGFSDVLRFCKDTELRPSALYLAGKYAASDKRHAQAARHFTELEEGFPQHRLADDARLLRARSQLELGDEASFTRLLSDIAEDYPEGDMVLDGVFELALRRIERSDWGGAAVVLERGLSLAKRADLGRDQEWAGRERYFLARAWIETGERERGISEFEELIRQRPLSFYMLHAYARLLELDKDRALSVRASAILETQAMPFRFDSRPEFKAPAFQRALALMRVGELGWAERELSAMDKVTDQKPELLWAMVLLYDRAGAKSHSYGLARAKLQDWLGRWPVGDWASAWRLAFPRPYEDVVRAAAARFGVPESLIYAVMREESGFDAQVVSHADAYGLMQLIKPTAKYFGKKHDLPYSESALKRPQINIQLGASVLQNFTAAFPSNPLLGIPGYNAGPGRPRAWLKESPTLDFDVWVERIPFRETRRYTKRVLSSRAAYAFLYDSWDSEATHLPVRLIRD
jgi:soluble lytic murein transglycosylase